MNKRNRIIKIPTVLIMKSHSSSCPLDLRFFVRHVYVFVSARFTSLSPLCLQVYLRRVSDFVPVQQRIVAFGGQKSRDITVVQLALTSLFITFHHPFAFRIQRFSFTFYSLSLPRSLQSYFPLCTRSKYKEKQSIFMQLGLFIIAIPSPNKTRS